MVLEKRTQIDLQINVEIRQEIILEKYTESVIWII